MKEMFPNANLIIDGELEIITATGAAIHALQVLNGEVQPYIKLIENPIACGIVKRYNGFKISIYDIRPKRKSYYFRSKNRSIHEIIDGLIKKYGYNIGIIVIANALYLEPNQFENFKKEEFKKYGNIVHIATEGELDFNYYLTEKIKYSTGELIMKFEVQTDWQIKKYE